MYWFIQCFPYVVSELEYLSLLYTDVKGEAFQAFINDYFRGNFGQFFTPDPIKKMMVNIIKPVPIKEVVYESKTQNLIQINDCPLRGVA